MSAAPPAPLPFTVITSTRPDRLTKVLSLNPDGTLRKVAAAAMSEGHARRATALNLRDLNDHLTRLLPSQAVVWGLADRDDVRVVTQEEQPRQPHAIARDRNFLSYPRGPGVMMLDHDEVRPGTPGMTLDTLWGSLLAACPALYAAPMLCRPSASAGVFAPDGREMSPLTRWRIYIAVANAAEIDEAGKRLATLLWAAGCGWFKVNRAGVALERTILDSSVWKPEHLDFAAGAVLLDGLTRPPVPPTFYAETAPLFDLAQIVVTDEAQRSAADNKRTERAAVAAEVEATRENWIRAEAAKRNMPLDAARRLFGPASEHGELFGSFTLTMRDGQVITVADLLADPERWHKKRLHDPLEPDYNDDPRIAIALLKDGEPCIHSHAHGAKKTYRLLPDPATVGFGVGADTAAPPAPSAPSAPAERYYYLIAQDPYNGARALLQRHYAHAEGRRLVRWQGAFYRWNGAAWSELADEAARAAVYDFLDREGQIDYRPTQTKVTGLLDALKAAAHLDPDHSAPCWINGAPLAPPAELVACANGLLHLPSRAMLPATPRFFNLNAVPFNYQPHAAHPAQWLQFLREVWPNDPEAIATLQEVFGYLLTPDTSQQKIFLIVGPKRSGKGTIARVMTEMLGAANVAGPTLASMAGNFGLAPLVGKLAAVISDARLSGRADQKEVAENLLRISGEDRVEIDRKFLAPLTAQLSVRFVMLTNELPKIADASGAMASRFVILTMTESFLGREDPGLTARLLRELPGVLGWAVEGWHRLHARGYFVEPKSSAGAAQELADLGSPIGAFIREECQCGPALEVEVSRLFTAWSVWCTRQGIQHPGTSATFGRDLNAAVPSITQTRPREGESRVRVYRGIAPNGPQWSAVVRDAVRDPMMPQKIMTPGETQFGPRWSGMS